MPDRDRITVTVHDDHVARIDEVADRLRRAGMDVEQTRRGGGRTRGAAPPPPRPTVAATEGVAAVEDATAFSVPPPDSDLQ